MESEDLGPFELNESDDYPDFVDAYISYATDSNGNSLSDDQLERLTNDNSEFVQQMAHEEIMGRV